MTLGTSFKMAIKALGANKMRSLLTMLGVIIGVLAITLLVSLVSSATGEITGQVSGMGSELITVSISSPKPVYISLSEIEELANEPGIAAVSPTVSGNGSVKAQGKSMDTSITGGTQYYSGITNKTIEYGRDISQLDVENSNAVAIIGVGVADELFGQRAVIGENITIMGREFLIVGMLEEDGSSALMSNDKNIYIPYTTAQRLLKQTSVRSISVSAFSSDDVDAAQNAVNDFLMPYVKDEDYLSVFSQTSLLDTINSIMSTMSLLLGGIAGISLLVGGIGIMNIMLVSVTERTREIGIRKAIGARRGNILTQFLIEAMVLSLIGGLIGILLGMGAGAVLSPLMDMTISISADVALLAVGFSLGVGVAFGIYPANKASKMRPIDALRYE